MELININQTNQINQYNHLIVENLSLLTHSSIYCKCLTVKQTLLYLFVTVRKFKENNKWFLVSELASFNLIFNMSKCLYFLFFT